MLQSHLGSSILFLYMVHPRHWGHALVLSNASHRNQSKHKCHVKKPFFTYILIMNQCCITKENRTLMTQRRPYKKQKSHPYPNLLRKEQHKQNIHRHAKKKEENEPKRKQTIVQVDDLLV